MLFVSHLYPYDIRIQGGKTRFEWIQSQQEHQAVVMLPELWAKFHRGALPFAVREAARAAFDSRFGDSQNNPPGPYRHAGVAADPDFVGFMYDASDDVFGYSMFDTETDCDTGVDGMTDDEVRALYERVLSAHPDLRSGDFILVEQPKTLAPWATYDQIVVGEGRRNAEWVTKTIFETARTIGADVAQGAAYERENANRDYALEAWQRLAEERVQALSELEALSA